MKSRHFLGKIRASMLYFNFPNKPGCFGLFKLIQFHLLSQCFKLEWRVRANQLLGDYHWGPPKSSFNL